ncbi:MAG: PP2C family protein-serine/threonine phosphatase [Desulfovibrio sp.]
MLKKRILIYDTDQSLLASLGNIFELNGYTVVLSESLEDALNVYDKHNYRNEPIHVVLSGVDGGVAEGMALVEQVRERNVPVGIIVASSSRNPDLLVKLLETEIDGFLRKPFRPSGALATLKKVLKRMQRLEKYEEYRQLALEERNRQLNNKIKAYESSYDSLRSQVESAVHVHREFIEISDQDSPVTIAYRNRPLKDLGGDFVGIHNTQLGCDIIMADVAGHDMSASYHTVLVKAFFEDNQKPEGDGESFFQFLNHFLSGSGQNTRMVTAAYVRLNLDEGWAEVTSAGHPPVLVMAAGGCSVNAVEGAGNVLGLGSEVEFETSRFPISSGDRLFMYTDGIINAFYLDGPSGKRFSLRQTGLEQLLSEYCDRPLQGQIDASWEGVRQFCRRKQTDDMLLFAVEVP